MVQAHPSQKSNRYSLNRLPDNVCLLVRDRLVSRITTMCVVVVHDVRVTNMLTEHRGRNLGSIRGIFVGD